MTNAVVNRRAHYFQATSLFPLRTLTAQTILRVRRAIGPEAKRKGKPMTKGELRRARRAAVAEGRELTGELAVGPVQEFSETPRGYRARERWARHYDSLNGAPEGDWDR